MKPIYYLCFVLSALILISPVGAFGQDSFYYFHGARVAFDPSPDKISVKFKSPVTPGQIQALAAQEPQLDASRTAAFAGEKNLHTIGLKDSSGLKQLLARLQEMPEIEIASPVYLYRGREVTPTDRFMVKFRS
ncbi:MAG: hypothetical protein ACE5JB_11825 [bacterium]